MYTITFNDGTIFTGDNPPNSKWNKIPDKPIKKIYYEIFGFNIILQNYVAYNHIVEYVHHLMNINQEVNITKIMLMGKKSSDEVDIYIFTKNNDIQHYVEDFGAEYYGKPTTGWKKGITNE